MTSPDTICTGVPGGAPGGTVCAGHASHDLRSQGAGAVDDRSFRWAGIRMVKIRQKVSGGLRTLEVAGSAVLRRLSVEPRWEFSIQQ